MPKKLWIKNKKFKNAIKNQLLNYDENGNLIKIETPVIVSNNQPWSSDIILDDPVIMNMIFEDPDALFLQRKEIIFPNFRLWCEIHRNTIVWVIKEDNCDATLHKFTHFKILFNFIKGLISKYKLSNINGNGLI